MFLMQSNTRSKTRKKTLITILGLCSIKIEQGSFIKYYKFSKNKMKGNIFLNVCKLVSNRNINTVYFCITNLTVFHSPDIFTIYDYIM